jgi:lipopolysaccharide/colanic/teichoic acid biosynthesis glycosyltransferase
VAPAANRGRRVPFGDPAERSDLAKRLIDVFGAGLLLFLTLPLLLICALAIKLDSRGPVLYRASRVGRGGRPLGMLKFRKMHVDATGPALTAPDDDRFTRVGRVLAATKVDELPQLLNVLRGEMSLVGPRPEDPSFVRLHEDAYGQILEVRPGITGLSQLAFAREARILAKGHRLDDYVRRILPQKMAIDLLYARRFSPLMDVRILLWTLVAVVLGREIAVHRETGALNFRVRPALRDASWSSEAVPAEATQAAGVETA